MPWEPILPKHPLVDTESIQGKAETRMRRFANTMLRRCKTYEVPAPTAQAVKTNRGGSLYRQSITTNRRFFATRAMVKRNASYVLGEAYEVYRRTNTLKRSWSNKIGWGLVSRALVGEIRSSGNIAPYNKYVRGPIKGAKGKRQAAHMARRGWLSVETIRDEEWPKAERDFRRILAGK
jgi:hypothetical protein